MTPDDMPREGDYSERLDAVFDSDREVWVCCECLGVVGSIGCCRFRGRHVAPGPPDAAPVGLAPPDDPPARQDPRQAPAKARRAAKPKGPTGRGGGAPVPYAPKPGPFEVRLVDEDRRMYRRVGEARMYAEACAAADVAVTELRSHVVVWWPEQQRVLYDSRKIEFRWPWWRAQEDEHG